MTFKVFKASDFQYEGKVEISTLEDLIKFKEECGTGIVIDYSDNTDDLSIMIYDDYLE